MNGFLAETAKFTQNTSISDFWIGLNTLMIPGNWTWMDNSNFDFNKWGPSEPANLSLNCASVKMENGNWGASDCFQLKPSVCKLAPVVTPTYPSYLNCSDGWYYFELTDSCYGHDQYIITANWTQGEETCQSQGGHLVSIHSFEEAKFVSCKSKDLL